MAKEPKIQYAAAVGDGDFPFDMLRYDFCSPANESEARDMGGARFTEGKGLEIRVIVLKRWNVAGEFTQARWRSFDWSLLGPFTLEGDARAAGNNLKAQIEKSKAKA